MTDKWHRIADQMAVELAPMASCSTHHLEDADPANCPDCAIRRVYLDYLAAGGIDTRLDTVFADTRSVPIQDLPMNPHMRLPGRDDQ